MGKKPQKKQQIAADDDDMHAKMLAQLGLQADTKEGKEMLGVLKKKLNKTDGDDNEGWQEAAHSSDGEAAGGE